MPRQVPGTAISSEPDLEWEEPEARRVSSGCHRKIFPIEILSKADAGQ